MKNKTIKCYWCNNEAEGTDYRDFNGVVSKIHTCKKCFEISTEHLRKRKNLIKK